MRLPSFLLSALCVALGALGNPALAKWPEQSIRIVVPYPAGGGVDVMMRMLAPLMSEQLGQPVVIDNRAGANANIGTAIVGTAKPDGYTLLASATFLTVNPLLETGLAWKASDFTPVAGLSRTYNLFMANGTSPWKGLGDFVAAARAQPGLNIAPGGSGSPQSMAHRMLRVRAGLQFTEIPYRGTPPLLVDLANGTLAMAVAPLAAVLGMLESGKLKALAVAGEERARLLPDVPTTAEAGYPDVVAPSWYGLHAPAGTPPEIVQAIAEAARIATADAKVQATALKAGGETAFLHTRDFEALLVRDRQRWERIVAEVSKGQ
ncbi:tripartite tricarboxylate transporter substrate binding protein [Reyranella massiliensis]|uniref:tripartite tricarboxylate transporter substrate binding protein n=1 Tax=Reyranella massiliensis TaxID=445220 RepID=UPI0002EAC4E9|nr:tripartite tricarboxylate transporter substrate binding protein [Reyranella massiliensis]